MKSATAWLLFCCLFLACGTSKTSTNKRDLTGTTWIYSDHKITYNVTFKARGKLSSTNKADQTPNNDVWEQNGNNVKYSYNNQYAIYTGKFVTDDLITGTTINKVEVSWKWKLVREKK